MRGLSGVRVWLGKACGFGLLAAVLFACGDNGIPIKDLRGQVQGGSKRNVELVFAAGDPVVALVDNRRGALYAATITGDVYKITGVNKAERILRGLATCETSWNAFAVTSDGRLVTNLCRDKRDILVTLSDRGQFTDLAIVPGRVLALANDARGKLYVASWSSEGNLSVSLNPRSLAGAEFISGRIFEMEAGGSLNQIYEGSIPVWIAVSNRNVFYASLWGKKGYFAPEKKTYGYVDPYRAYWLALSDKVQLLSSEAGTLRFENSLINSLTLFLIPEDEYLLGYGMTKEGDGGLFLVEENRPPIKLLFREQKLDRNITSLALYDSVVYFGNAEGGIYRIK